MRYIEVKPGEKAKIKTKKEFNWETITEAVGGVFSALYLHDIEETYILYCADDFRGLEPNIQPSGAPTICGTVIITKHDGHGGDVSLTMEEARNLCKEIDGE